MCLMTDFYLMHSHMGFHMLLHAQLPYPMRKLYTSRSMRYTSSGTLDW